MHSYDITTSESSQCAKSQIITVLSVAPGVIFCFCFFFAVKVGYCDHTLNSVWVCELFSGILALSVVGY